MQHLELRTHGETWFISHLECLFIVQKAAAAAKTVTTRIVIMAVTTPAMQPIEHTCARVKGNVQLSWFKIWLTIHIFPWNSEYSSGRRNNISVTVIGQDHSYDVCVLHSRSQVVECHCVLEG